jgi:Cd2+/Zn2+-exporting ATPase
VAAMPYTALVGLCFGARQGVIFRHAKAMEKTAEANVAVFDKAGIFSSGEPELRSFQSEILDERTFMSFVAHAVYYSEQPFAKAIPTLGEQEYKLNVISDFVDVPGCGVELKIGGSPVVLATRAYLTARGIQLPEAEESGETYYLTVAGRYIGSLGISSQVNENAAELLEAVKEAGFRETILLTEDGAGESRRLAEELGVDDVYAECDTERKLRHIEELNQSSRNHVMFLYANGVETHTAADVDVRLNRKAKYADVAIPPENTAALPFTIQICRRMCQVAKENAIFVFAVKALMIFLSMIGYNSIWFVMFMDIAAVLATLLNAIRVTKDPLIDLRRMAEEDDFEQ